LDLRALDQPPRGFRFKIASVSQTNFEDWSVVIDPQAP